jgi:23S rRNA pseudouridine955/2504/2580 synthase
MLVVDEDSAGQRLDNYLLRHLKGVPKTWVYRIIRKGEVRINKGRVQADTRVNPGDQVRVPPLRMAQALDAPPDPAVAKAARGAKPFTVLYEDDHLIALDKPSGLAVHGGSGVSLGVIELLRATRPDVPVLELVHRLDRETSGVLLVAKRRSALRHIQDQFRGRETGKTYLAMVRGQWPKNKKVVDMPLFKYQAQTPSGETERRVQVVADNDPRGQRAISLVKVARLVGPHSLLEVVIKTGRTHQIRVHLSSQGHPILGDDKYGDFPLNKDLQSQGLKRMFLHAWKLTLKHPHTGQPLALSSPLPADLQLFIQQVQPDVAPL